MAVHARIMVCKHKYYCFMFTWNPKWIHQNRIELNQSKTRTTIDHWINSACRYNLLISSFSSISKTDFDTVQFFNEFILFLRRRLWNGKRQMQATLGKKIVDVKELHDWASGADSICQFCFVTTTVIVYIGTSKRHCQYTIMSSSKDVFDSIFRTQ